MEEIGQLISNSPFILAEDAYSIQLKIAYLSSKRFTREQISRIVTAEPDWLLQSIDKIDGRLGTLQQLLKLPGKPGY